MLMLVGWIGVAWWYRSMALRSASKRPVSEHERALAARWNRRLRWGLLAAFVGWVLALVVLVSQEATMEAAEYAVRQCSERVEGAALQACLAPAQQAYVEAAGAAASAGAIMWILGVL